MTDISVPLWLQGGTYAADDDRGLLRALVKSAGIIGSTDLAVTQNGTPNMSVNVAAGRAFVQRTSATDYYMAENDATANLVISAADPTNPRRDLIVVRVYDAAFSGALNKATVEVVVGTPAASPVDPTVPSNCFVVARVAVAAAAASIVNANITDLRTFYGPNRPANAQIVYTASGTLTATQAAGATGLRVRVWGGGGGAGGCAANAAGNSSGGGGGGGGGYAESLLDIASVTFPVAITVGAGVAGGAAGANAGVNGNASSFAALVAASGGTGGGAGSTGATVGLAGNGGNGGAGTAGQIQIVGSDGVPGLRVAAGSAIGGVGGGAAMIGSIRRQIFSNQTDGANALAYGGGGSGGVSQASGAAQAGGQGGGGLVTVELIY